MFRGQGTKNDMDGALHDLRRALKALGWEVRDTVSPGLAKPGDSAESRNLGMLMEQVCRWACIRACMRAGARVHGLVLQNHPYLLELLENKLAATEQERPVVCV